MAGCKGSEQITDSDSFDESVDLSVWIHCQDTMSYWRKSCSIYEIMKSNKLDQLKRILKCGWEVNEALDIPWNNTMERYKPIALLSYVIINYEERDNFMETVKLLLEHGANPNVAHRVNVGYIGYREDMIVKYREDKWVQRTALHEAARLGLTEVVKVLLDAGAECTASTTSQTPLALALLSGKCPPELIELLLKHGADPNDHDDQFDNIPLLNAIERFQNFRTYINPNRENSMIILKLLLQHGANPTVAHRGYEQKENGENAWLQMTALDEAASRGCTEGVKMLLDAGAKADTSALIEAAGSHNTEVVKILLSAGAKCTASDGQRNPLASVLGYLYCPDLIEFMLQHGADPNDHDEERRNIPLLEAIWNRWADENDRYIVVKLLLQYGADPNVMYWEFHIGRYSTALALAAEKEHCVPDIIQLLLEAGADPNDHDDHFENIPLLNAIESRRQNPTIVVKLLLEHGANPNVVYRVKMRRHGQPERVPRTALHAAIEWTYNEIDVVKMLLDSGATLPMADALENTLALAMPAPPLMEPYNDELIQLLLDNGADPNDHNGRRDNIPLFKAIRSHNLTVIKMLLEHGADPNVTCRVDVGKLREAKWETWPALHEAGKRGQTEAVKMLLGAGADYKTPGVLENTLTVAFEHRWSPDLIELLLNLEPDIDNMVVEDRPLVQALYKYVIKLNCSFLPQLLDLVFLHGGNINVEDGPHTTGLQGRLQHDAIRQGNTVRWLIRHGADVANIRYSWLLPSYGEELTDIPLILLQAGARGSPKAYTHLSNTAVALSTGLQEEREEKGNISRILQDMWAHLEKDEKEEFQRIRCKPEKCNFPEYWIRQMVDLQEFSDESLYVYPEDTDIEDEGSNASDEGSNASYSEVDQNMLNQINRILEFLSQPQSLQWYSRRCVRENLVSLQPSVVKSLPGPSRLKRFILCHEI